MATKYKNRENAWKHFYPKGNGIKAKPGYVLHHVDDTMCDRDPDRYNEWNITDLVMMTKREHLQLHKIGKSRKPFTEEHCKKISIAQIGVRVGSKNSMARRILCVTTGEIFNCMKDAADKYHVNRGNLTSCCQGKYKSAGKLNGIKLVWKYI